MNKTPSPPGVCRPHSESRISLLHRAFGYFWFVFVLALPVLVLLFLLNSKLNLLQLTAADGVTDHVVINELCAKNLSGITDCDGDASDWIELYNPTEHAVDLTGWGLSDEEADSFRWVFPKTLLPAKSYLVVFASGKNKTEGDELHTSFSLSGSGDTLTLSTPTGAAVDTVRFGDQKWDISYGRQGLHSSKFCYFDHVTPGRSNPAEVLNLESDLVLTQLPTVEFSQPGGFYSEPFALSLSAPLPGALIVYTLNGAEPTEKDAVYHEPLTVSGNHPVQWAALQSTPQYPDYLYDYGIGSIATCTVVRAAVYFGGKLSQTVTQTYFVAPQTTLPIVSLNTDPELLFDSADGLYVPGKTAFLRADDDRAGNYLQGTSVSGNLELFGADGTPQLNDEVSFHLCGNASRSFSQQKSFRVQLQNDTVNFELGGVSYALSGFDLRTPRTDEPSYTLYRDGFAENLLQSLNLGTQAGIPVQLYLDGEYWGIYYLKETLNDNYLNRHYGVLRSNIDAVKMSDDWQVKYGRNTLLNEISAWYDQLQSCDLTDEAQYRSLVQTLDVENFAAYIAAEAYLNSTDWIQHENNIMLWRADIPEESNPYADGRWRFAIYDLDIILQNEDEDTLAELLDYPCDPANDHYLPLLLFQKLWQREDFRALFADTLNAQLTTVYAPESITAAWDTHVELLRPEMEQELERIRLVPRDTALSRFWRNSVDPDLHDPENIPLEDWDVYTWFVGDFVRDRSTLMTAFLAAALAR